MNPKFAKVIGLMAAAGISLAACATPTPAPTAVPAPKAAEPTKAPVAAPAAAGKVLFYSSQAAPVNEAEAMRKVVLAGFKNAEFVAEATGPWIDKSNAEAKAGGKGTVDVMGGLAGDMSVIRDNMADLSAVAKTKFGDRNIPASFWEVSKLGTDKTLMVPWMQATLVMAVNKKALKYLPQGADVNNLTYDQLLAWGKAMKDGEKEGKIGFAAGNNGLIHRFFQGYLLPAFTGGTAATYGTDDAGKAWAYFRDLWAVVNPQSTTYNFMQEPLSSGEVWVAIDHVARLKDAFANKPDDFVAAPAPVGPKGRAYMVILAGLSIPKNAPNAAGAESLIDYMTKAEAQASTLNAIGFYPVTGGDLPASAPAWQRLMTAAVKTQAADAKALPVLIPQGLGAKGGDFNKVYRDTFTEIVINKADIKATLDKQKAILQTVMNDAKAPCWAPDPVKAGEPCKIN
jgi:multiple sugar transport system substrate-binding protein